MKLDPQTEKAIVAVLFYEPSEKHADVMGKVVANVVINDLPPLCDEFGTSVPALDVDRPDISSTLSQICFLRAYEFITTKHLKTLLRRVFEVVELDLVSELVSSKLLEEADSSEIDTQIDKILAANPGVVEQFRGGKTTVSGFLVGQVMKAFKGKADPALIKNKVLEKLA